jgi:adenine-specific DNA methylase
MVTKTDVKAPSVVPRPVHPFPARMAAAIPWEELSAEPSRRLRVLDPMTGSGTTLAVARVLGHLAIGFDTDPLAILIARAWCEDVDEKRLRRAAKRAVRRAAATFAGMRSRDAYPPGADDETRRFIRYWFDQRNRKELAALSTAILRVRDEHVRALLLCGFSRLIIAKQAGASLALDLAHSRPHRVNRKATIVRPLSAFVDEIEQICRRAPFRSPAAAPIADIREGDARALPLGDGTVDIVITSPPYVNGIDYQRTTKFSLVWMGYSIGELRKVRTDNIGTEAAGRSKEATEAQRAALQAMGAVRRLPERTVNILRKYVRDMDAALREIARVLCADGRAVVVIGDSTMRGTYVRNSRAILVLAEACGLQQVRVRRRRLPPNRRYLPPPRHAEQLDRRLRTESILHLRKTA